MAALFEECEIRSVFDPSSNSPGYILQARATPGDVTYVLTSYYIIHAYLRDHHVLRAEPAVRGARLARVLRTGETFAQSDYHRSECARARLSGLEGSRRW